MGDMRPLPAGFLILTGCIRIIQLETFRRHTGAAPGWVFVFANLDRGGAFVRPPTPAVCAGCGELSPWHPWGCPVLIRLCAQLLRREAGGRWRAVARESAAGVGDLDDPEARHWLAVAAEPGVPAAWTPDLLPGECGDGMVETTAADRVNYPGAADLLKRLRSLKATDDPAKPPPLLRGAVVCPFVFPPPTPPDRSAARDAHAH